MGSLSRRQKPSSGTGARKTGRDKASPQTENLEDHDAAAALVSLGAGQPVPKTKIKVSSRQSDAPAREVQNTPGDVSSNEDVDNASQLDSDQLSGVDFAAVGAY
jgi:hypothetical protein